MIRKLCLCLASLAATPVAAQDDSRAQAWTCRNNDAEITCADGACNVATAGGFTPMSVTATTNAKLSLCAYSGCWEGRAETMTTTGNQLSWAGTDLRWSQEPDAPGITGSVVIDTETLVGFVMVADFVHPLTCDRN